MPANQTVERTLIGVWADRNNWPDGKVSAINLDASYANTTFPSNVTVFTREFSCATGDRLNPTERAYLFIKTRDNEGKKNDIMSDRFTMIDNRNTANAASAFYTIQCLYVGDKLGVRLPVRKESDMHSDNLPATSDKLF